MTIYMSSGAFRARTVPRVIDDALRLGITHVELSSGLAHEPDLYPALKRGMDSGLTFLVHNYFPAPADPKVLNLTAGDPEGLTWSLNHCRRALDLSVTVGGGFYSLHSGFAVSLKASMLGKPDVQAAAMKNTTVDREAAHQLMIRSVREIADYAAARGKSLLLENNVISPVYLEKVPVNPLLMTHHDEIVRFMGEVDRPNVGFLIDTGHAKVSATAQGFDTLAFMAAVKPYIRALHLSDNDGREDQNLPFTEQSWFYPLLRDYAHLPMVIEAYNLDDQTMLAQRALLAQAIAAR
jgi:sugar phosphate isomerase/epimerase